MKKDIHLVQKILFLVIGVLSIMLMAVLILKVRQLHQEKLQKEEWEVRHVEVQAEVDDFRMKIQELSEDSDALQAFLHENLNQNKEESAQEKENIVPEEAAEESWEGMAQSGDAILIDAPEYRLPQPPDGQADSISDNSASLAAPEDMVSSNRAAAGIEDETVSSNKTARTSEEETVSSNKTAQTSEEETVSSNKAAQSAEEETVSSNGAAQTSEEETVSGNKAAQSAEDETVSGNEIEQPSEAETISGNRIEREPYETISGNAIVDGKVIPFQYNEADLTLEARRNIRSSYAETEQTNGEDRFIISNSNYDFSGLTIACLGDSLTEGSNLDHMESYEQYAYPSVLKRILRAKEVYNLGIGGSSYGRYWDQAFVDRYKEIPKDTDIIIVMGGTNDGFAASEKELGSLSEKKAKTFYGDVDELMRGLKENYPKAKIIFATPLPNVLHDYLRSQREYLLPQSIFAKAIKELAAQYDIDVIDLYNSNLLDTHDAQVISSYMPDGVHGNPAGYQILAEHMASRIIRIMEDEALVHPTVSGNSAEIEGNFIDESVSGNEVEEEAEAVSGNAAGTPHMQDGKWIEEEIMSEEERAWEEREAKENGKKAAQEVMLVEPAAQGNSDSAAGGQDGAQRKDGEEEEEEEPMIPYEYGGEAIIIP